MSKIYSELPEKSEYARRSYARALYSFAKNGFAELPLLKTPTDYISALGAPLDRKFPEDISVSNEYIGSDELCEISRLCFSPLHNLPFFGLLFVPHNIRTPAPLVVAAHGNLGTPELMYGMHGKNGYSNLIQRLLKRGVCVFAPQLFLWNDGTSPQKPCYETKCDRAGLDALLKTQKSSITALELFCINRSASALERLHIIDMSRLGVCGMSYGAFLTLRAMAINPKIKAGYFMCCFNGGLDERYPEWQVRNGFSTPRDHEIASMCAPRKIFVEAAKYDEFFPISETEREAKTAFSAYIASSAKKNFSFNIWEGNHIVPSSDKFLDLFVGALSEK